MLYVQVIMILVQAFQGDYDWMLYGHDDTFFFVEADKDVLVSAP